MILIGNSLYFDLIIGKYSNFITEQDLLYFAIDEMSGLAKPMFTVIFRTKEKHIKDQVIENNQVKVRIGESPSKCDEFTMSIGEPSITQDSANNGYKISFEGILGDKIFIHFRKDTDYYGTSLEVLHKLSKEYFGKDLDSDITKVNEKPMVWQQSYETANVFMCDVWLHMNNMPSTQLMAIDKYGTPYLRDLANIKSSKAKYIFTQGNPSTSQEIRYLNTFKPESYKTLTNFQASDYVTYTPNLETGKTKVYVQDNDPELAATKIAEKSENGTFSQENVAQCDNMHSYYQECYQHNKAKLVRLSSIIGELMCIGYYPNIKVLDLVEVDTEDNSYKGKYIVVAISTTFTGQSSVQTKVYVARDNINSIENSAPSTTGKFIISSKDRQNFYEMIRNTRRMISMARNVVSGGFFIDSMKFITQLKTGLLSSFRVLGAPLDLNGSIQMVRSLQGIGNNLVNKIIEQYIPYPFNSLLKDFAIQQPTMRNLFSRLLTQYLPEDTRYLILEVSNLFSDITSGLGILLKDNTNTLMIDNIYTRSYVNSNVKFTDSTTGITNIYSEENMSTDKDMSRVEIITDKFIGNMFGADLPIPFIHLTENESLLNDIDLTNLLADRIIVDLEDRGYLDGIDNFKDILLGNSPLDFNTLNTINSNIGMIMHSRYWGVFMDTEELTDFFIKKQFRDKYKTIPCTKIVDARGGKRLYVALPSTEKGVKFFINSNMINMDKIDSIDIGVRNKLGNIIYYDIYMSPKGYNSNSNILELRK